MTTLTLLDAQAGDANSTAARAKREPGNNSLETVLIRGYGTWNGATMTITVSDDNSTFTGLVNESGTAIGAFTDDFAVNLDIPKGIWFRVEVSGSGSPTSSLTARATGDLE